MGTDDTASERGTHENRLAEETSPYLLQHAHNPVDWYPWGPEALDKARREDKPILLSIGYAACHWCHVMERESFENEDIARVMNDHFVSIKVDREERPDLDEIYMAATVALSGQGGWPMTVFLTPDKRPFFAGTYFPPTDKYGRPGFGTLLERIAELWRADRKQLTEQADELTNAVTAQARTARPANVSSEAIDQAVRTLRATFDEAHGGFGGAPKFPPSAALSLLLRRHRQTKEPSLLEMVTTTLEAMKNGGIYDQIGGGFARYSTDERWLVPHFEKMLYDNAQLSRVYLEAFQVTGQDEYRRIATETLDYVAREMQDTEGGYYSATDADSEGVEGKFFVWTPDQVREILDEPDAEWFCEYYDVRPEGNWEGVSILNVPRSLEVVAGQLGIERERLSRSLDESRKKLYAARRERVPPLLDDKILTAWNGLMIGAMAEGARVLDEPRYLDSASRAADYILQRLRRPDGGLYRTARGGRAHLDAYLEDYAYLTDALVDLYEAGGGSRFLFAARDLADRMVQDFGDDERGAFYHTAHAHEPLLVRMREGNDGALPSPNAVAARALGRLAVHCDRPEYRDRAEGAIRAYGQLIERQPRAFVTALSVVDFLLEGPVELVFAGSFEDARHRALRDAIATRFLPNRVIGFAATGEAEPEERPLLVGKTPIDGQPALYICRDFTCREPVTEPGRIDEALEAARPAAEATASRSIGQQKRAGSATGDATRAYASAHERLGARAYTRLGKTAWTVSRLGFGCYRVDDRVEDHRAALSRALGAGVNLIDTSTNYGDGHSERLVGDVVRELDRDGRVPREAVVVVSKIGYAQGKNLELSEQRKKEGRPFSEMVDIGEGLSHCIQPEWIEDQLGRSLERLGLETLDVCLLHNPEYFLSVEHQRGAPLEASRKEFYRRLREAFSQLEKEIQRGRIGAYGVSSNTVQSPEDDPDATDLSLMLRAAEDAGGPSHHFRVLELPMNLLEAGALLERNTASPPVPVLRFAEDNGIAVLVNRPLNAIVQGRLIRLADPPIVDSAPPLEAKLGQVRALEEQFAKTYAASLRLASGKPLEPREILRWAEQLAELPSQLESVEQWRDIREQAVLPQIGEVLGALDRAIGPGGGQTWKKWMERYAEALEGLFAAIESRAAGRSEARARAVGRAINPSFEEAKRDEPLSRKALAVVASSPGVTSVLVGMRRTEYVDDALEVLGWEPVTDPAGALAAAREADLPGL